MHYYKHNNGRLIQKLGKKFTLLTFCWPEIKYKCNIVLAHQDLQSSNPETNSMFPYSQLRVLRMPKQAFGHFHLFSQLSTIHHRICPLENNHLHQ